MGIKKFYTCAVKRKLISLHISDERNNCRPKRILVYKFIRSATKRIRVKYNVSQRKRTIYRQKVYTQVLYLYDIIYMYVYMCVYIYICIYIYIYIYLKRYNILRSLHIPGTRDTCSGRVHPQDLILDYIAKLEAIIFRCVRYKRPAVALQILSKF